MTKARLSTEEILRLVEEDRLRRERLEEPYLIAFRATPEEIEMRKVEDAKEADLPDEGFRRRAERIARCGREAVRFGFYLRRQGFYPNIPKNDPNA
jgi:hypothetical protein